MRLINAIIVHCTDNTATSRVSLDDIRQWHVKHNGWRDIGYHYVVFPDGRVERGRPISQAGAHTYGHNAHSIGVAYVGGRLENGQQADTRTPEQKGALVKLIYNLVKMYRCDVYGHRDFTSAKQCPCFDAHKEYTNIYRREVGLDNL